MKDFNKAEHTVAIRNLLPVAEQKLREKRLGDAREFLWIIKRHVNSLLEHIDKTIVDER